MADWAVKVTLQGTSGMPEDVYENTFAMVVSIDTQANAEAAAAEFITMYQDLQEWLSPQVSAEPNAHSIAFYRIADPEPRAPFLEGNFDLTPGDLALPSELALCSSLQGDRDSGDVPARCRGRFYFGPLNFDAIVAGSDTEPARPAPAFLTALQNRTEEMAENLGTAAIGRLGVWSRADNVVRLVVGGWVDNEFDIQRRRGSRADSRETWTYNT